MLRLYLSAELSLEHYRWGNSPTYLNPPHRRPKRFARDIIREVADKYGLAAETLIGPERSFAISAIRHEAMWRVREETTLSLPRIGAIFGGRDHTTVIHGLRRHVERLG